MKRKNIINELNKKIEDAHKDEIYYKNKISGIGDDTIEEWEERFDTLEKWSKAKGMIHAYTHTIELLQD